MGLLYKTKYNNVTYLLTLKSIFLMSLFKLVKYQQLNQDPMTRAGPSRR